jgi:DnaK suppressor protein
MTDQQKDAYKEMLQKELQRITDSIVTLEETTQAISPDNAIGRISRMDAIGNKAINDSALLKARSKFDAIEVSLSNYGSFMFGCCESCGNEIQFKRLEAIPGIKICMQCSG